MLESIRETSVFDFQSWWSYNVSTEFYTNCSDRRPRSSLNWTIGLEHRNIQPDEKRVVNLWPNTTQRPIGKTISIKFSNQRPQSENLGNWLYQFGKNYSRIWFHEEKVVITERWFSGDFFCIEIIKYKYLNWQIIEILWHQKFVYFSISKNFQNRPLLEVQ